MLNKKMELQHVMNLFAVEGTTFINLVPVLLNWMVNAPDFDAHDFSSLRYIIYGGSPIPMTILEKCLERITGKFSQGFGLAESTVLGAEDHVISDDPVKKKCLQSVGREVYYNWVREVGDGGGDLPPGEIGEIKIKGPNVMKGYWRDAEQTEGRIGDGWLYSNDMGYFDEDMYLYIVVVDRK
ncbi:MAG: AMP-binding protein [Actinomycetota bacterium]|nr:AMP-binding protein [Actinomycetota bacterium]